MDNKGRVGKRHIERNAEKERAYVRERRETEKEKRELVCM
jgi:hypothetical protein